VYCFVNHWLSFCCFSFWAIILSALFRLTASVYFIGLFKLFVLASDNAKCHVFFYHTNVYFSQKRDYQKIRHHHIPNKPILSKDTIHSIQAPNHSINNSIHNPVDISKGMAVVTNKQMSWYICSFVIRFV